jgi:PAS domain S-box-containing protein
MWLLGEPWGSLLLFLSLATTVSLAIAASLLVRDTLRMQARTKALEAEVEKQGDTIWELRESEERSRSLIDGQGDLIVRRDLTGRIVFANDAYIALTGKPREDVIGKNVNLTIVERQPPQSQIDGVICRDEAVRTANGTVWIEWREVIVKGFTGRTETQAVGRDITARRAAEAEAARAKAEAEATNQAKSRFLATVSHEIRTPLGGVLGMADLLLESKLAPAQTTYAKAIKTSGEALLSLIDEILDFSKIESGRLDLDEKPFTPRAIVEDIVELLSPRAHAKGIDIASVTSAEVPEHLIGDAGRLKQVMLNLAGNAIKFTDKGGVIVRLTMHKGKVVFSVKDTGIGIAGHHVSRIFDEFEQAESGPSRRYGGTGLGLAISQRIVGRMGGHITVDSRPGEGSTFVFTLLLPEAEGELSALPNPRGKSVLIASPSVITGPALQWMLSDAHVAARHESDPDTVRELMAKERFDTVLVDRAFGLETAMTIVSAGLAASQRVLALVTPAERHELPRLTNAGAAGYLVKPVRAASLLAQIAGGPTSAPANDDINRPIERPLKGLATLLAEDNDINALLARTVLLKLGASVAWAKDGLEAVRLYQDGGFDAVLMDLHMPGIDGLAATIAIRTFEADNNLARKPIFALTANASEEDRQNCLAAGMDDYLTKPLDKDAMVALLTPLVRSGARRAARTQVAKAVVTASSA